MEQKYLINIGTCCLFINILEGDCYILNVVDEDSIPPSTLLAFLDKEKELACARQDLRSFIKSSTKEFLEEKITICNNYGVQNVKYVLNIGNPANEIINVAREVNTDLVVMACSKIVSPIRALGSIVRKVLDNIHIPVLVIHE